jgi:hypothetical protein
MHAAIYQWAYELLDVTHWMSPQELLHTLQIVDFDGVRLRL